MTSHQKDTRQKHEMKTETMNGIRMKNKRILWFTVFISLLTLTNAMDPKFDPSTRMRLVLVPADASVGTVIYRLRASDEEFDYPLTFELIGDSSASTVQIDSLPCTKYNSVCQANVVLTRRLEAGRYYDFQVSVKDTKGGTAVQSCSLTATNFTTPHDVIFPHKPGIIMISEDAKRGAELDYVISRKNPLFPKTVYLELWGSPLFAIRQKIVSPEMTEGTIFLLGPLDFEKQAMYHLTILANDAYAEPGQDTRNIAGLEVVVIVEDVQDMAPIFTAAPPVTRLPSGLLPGDKILQVHAEDGDKGTPRDIRYGLVSEGNPFTSFFDINDTTGEIFLLRPLDEILAITHIGDPVLLTIVAEEVKVTRDEPPAMATTVQIAFLLPERSNSPPYFESDLYVARIEENSPQGTALVFPEPYITRVSDDDTGKNGVFSLTLLGNNGSFEITPNVAERQANFLIRVRDSSMLDYESYKSLNFQILAQELGPATNLSAIANVTVYIEDINDNPPVFSETIYTAELPENTTTGTRVTQVHADDIDTGIGSRVRYTQILGYLNTSLNLDAETGVITVSTDNHGFDREQMPEYHFYVEARDAEGNGNRIQVPLVIKLIDVNDESPIFERALYEFILASDLKNFTVPAFIKANDNDAEPPNNVIRYELLQGNYENKFLLNTVSGELTLREPLNFPPQQKNARRRRQTTDSGDMQIIMLTARAFDLGVPVKSSTTIIKVYPPESRMRAIAFIVPGLNPDRKKTEATLSAITGGRVAIQDIRPYTGTETGATDIGGGNGKERSVVLATVVYDGNSLVDIAHIQKNLAGSGTGASSSTTVIRDEENSATIYKAENRVLFWLLIFLALLIALIILAILFCCICSWCPLYAGARKRVIRVNSTEDDVHLVHREQGIGKESKSVQVAEWMGRREAWSAERSASDPRTKPTRWEFSRRNNNREKLGHDNSIQVDDDSSGKDIRLTSAEAKRIRKSRKNIKEISTAKEIQIHNSRTNLVTDRDVYVEDVIEDRETNDYQSVRRKNIEIDDDSMRRHEMDRGSEMDYGHRSSLKRQPAQEEQNLGQREQLFIKEGNAEILRLVTRGKTDDENIYVNVPQRPIQNVNSQPQYIMLDNMGKEILMRRYIEEQSNGKQVIREHYQVIPGGPMITQNIPNEVQNTQDTYNAARSLQGSMIYANQQQDANGEIKVTSNQNLQSGVNNNMLGVESDMQQATSHHSIIQQELENSLKQQNALLRQILLEKEKLEEKYNQNENMLETQSLPGHSMANAIATQTDCETGTQTDPLNQKPERRRARSENDDSMSEEDYEYVRYSPANSPDGVYYIKRKRHKKRSKYKDAEKSRRKVVVVESSRRHIRTPIQEENEESATNNKTPPLKHKETKASMLRRLKNSGKVDKSRTKSPSLNKDVLMEISDSLDDKIEQKYVRKTHTEIQYEESEGDTSNSEIAQDSLEEEQSEEEEEEKLRKIRKKSGRNISFSEPGSSTEAQMSITPELEFNRRKSSVSSRESKKSKHDKSRSVSPSTKRVSRRDSIKETVVKTKVRRQAASEPSSRTKAPKPPLKKAHSEKTRSEMDILKKLADEGVDVSKAVPRYMEWYFTENNKRRQSDDQKSESDKSRISSQTTTIKKSSLKKNASYGKSDERLDESSRKMESVSRNVTPTKTRLLREDIQMSKNFSSSSDTNHPRFQHSEHRFEYDYKPSKDGKQSSKLPQYLYPSDTPPVVNRETKSQMKSSRELKQKPKPSPIKEGEVKISRSRYTSDSDGRQKLNASTLEDDHDSGIAMNSLLHNMGRRNPIADKKSIFTIAYDDVKINKIRSESDTPPI